MRGTIAMAAVLGLLALGGCINTSGDAPAWFQQRSAANDESYPALRSVPREIQANTDAQYWDEVERDVLAAAAEMKASPRAEPAPAEDPTGFVEEAQEVLEETRQTHEP
jgi:hypothetical protein